MGSTNNDGEADDSDTLSSSLYSEVCALYGQHVVHNESVRSKKSVELWKRALQKLQIVDLDSWHNLSWDEYPTQIAIRHRYSAIKKKWVVDEIQIKLEPSPFDHGAMRECFRLKKLSSRSNSTNNWQNASNYVAKRYLAKVDKQVYFDDVRLQMEAKLWGEAFNRQNPPKKVDIFQLSVLEIRSTPLELSDHSEVSEQPTFYHIERFMEGEYRKYNSNSGFVDEQLRNTPQAFSHFTFERSGHRLLVVDIQGVGDLYTDPQIHTSDGVGYSDGNLGPRGMALFFHSHRCNPLCKWLGLAPFDLSPSELDALQSVTDHQKAPLGQLENSAKQSLLARRCDVRRRTVSLNHDSGCSFGPTVARSDEYMCSAEPRRRCASTSYDHYCSSDNIFDRTSSVMSVDAEYSFVPNPGSELLCTTISSMRMPSQTPVTTNSPYSRPLFPVEPILPRPVPQLRNRAASGDSGYSGRINLPAPLSVDLTSSHSLEIQTFSNVPELPVTSVNGNLNGGSSSSLLELSSPVSPIHPVLAPQYPDFLSNNLWRNVEDFGNPVNLAGHSPFGLNHSGFSRMGIFSKRQRNLSESSDIDAEEGRRLAGNLLHQLMHESHKPSCADHPTNLDQEIGQSILGQIHHEFARLHEAGRFMPPCKGGWSHAGIGGLLLRQQRNLDSSGHNSVNKSHIEQVHESGDELRLGEENYSEPTIDWPAILFHERHAAQLGCLEAMIIMAHYYLGLPTQLLLECPIKPEKNDIRVGIDYLWRAAEGGDRRCMILLARYLDVSAALSTPECKTNFLTTPRDLFMLPTLQTIVSENLQSVLPTVSPDSWSEAVVWYQRAVDSAANTIGSGDRVPDEGLDAEGRYDAAEDLLPVYRILARIAEMYSVGGFGLKQDYSKAGDLFNQAGELASTALQGRLAVQYFELSESMYGTME